jgi:hypothetical protein
MQRTFIMSALFLASVTCAQADHYVISYHDMTLPRGQERSMAEQKEVLDFCFGQTGDDPNLGPTPAMKKCMLGRGYKWVSTRLVRDKPAPGDPVVHGDYVENRPYRGIYSYEDMWGHARTEEDEQAASDACGGGHRRFIGTPGFNACMRAQGWRLSGVEPKPYAPDAYFNY